jgi:hypothetical protein
MSDTRIASEPVADVLDAATTALFRTHLHEIDARETCIVCDAGRWSAELREGLIARVCSQCGHVLLFSPTPLGLQPGYRLVDGHWCRALVPADSPPMRLADFFSAGQVGP